MASLSFDEKTGRRTVQFKGADGKRRSVRLGKVSEDDAEKLRGTVAELSAVRSGEQSFSPHLAAWVKTTKEHNPTLYDRLAAVGLVDRRQTPAVKMSLGAFLQSWIDKRAGAKPHSLKIYRDAAGKLKAHFGEAVKIDTITPGMANDYARAVATKHAKDWAMRLVKFARQFFHDAVRDRLITENPFIGAKPQGVRSPKGRKQFFNVTPEMAEQVLAACPNAEWKLIFALARYGGLRVDSERNSLRWDEVDWKAGKFIVHAPKTEHHDNGGVRIIPIFEELRPYFEAARAAAPADAVHVIAKHRGNTTVATSLKKFVRRAGLTPWPCFLNNLRSTRQRELIRKVGLKPACEWIGNSARVAEKHYDHVTQEDFDKVTGGATSGANAVQNPVHRQSSPSNAEPHESENSQGKTRFDGKTRRIGEAAKYTRQESNLQPMAP